MRFSYRIGLLITLLGWLFGPAIVQAGTIKGKVSGTNNEGLAFANVTVRGTATSTGSNDQGQYQLKLPAGQYQLVFQYVGYRPRTESIRVPAGDSTVVLNVALVPESYNLAEVSVRGTDRDPAYAIIQQAQQWRSYHQREIATFQARLYIKSLIRLSETPSKVFGLFKVGPDVKPGILYLSESLSDIRFTQPNTIKERMLSSRVSGDSRGISFNRARNGLNFYDNVLKPDFSERGFVSPIANNSFLFYQYELVGTTQQGGELVHKIRVIPRRRTDPVFSGFIYIVDGSWRLHSVDVRLTKDAQLDYVDDLHIEQLFAPAPAVPHVWALQSQKLSVNFSAFGFKGSGYATAVFSNYNHVAATYPAPPEVKKTPASTPPATAAQPAAPPVVAPVTTKELTRQIKRQKPDLSGLNKQVRRQVKQARRDSVRNDPFAQMRKGEVLLVEKGVNERDSSYWSQIRPVPLTEEEKLDYHKKDSSEVIRNSRPYQDSLDRKRNEFTPTKLLLGGYTYRNTFRKTSFSVQPIFNELQYNTVEGYVLNAQATYTRRTDDRRFVTLTPTLRYGFQNEQLQPSLTINWQLDPVKLRQVGIIAGRTIENFDRNTQLTPFANSVYSLLANRNYAKLYRRDGAEISYFWEPVNGLTVRGATGYFDRHELENTSTYLWNDVKGRAFTSNLPEAEEMPEGTGFGRSRAATLSLVVSYRPGTQYITRPDGKYNLGTKYPTFTGQIRQGVGAFGTHVRYTLLQGSVRQTVQLGLLGTSAYEAIIGGFVGSQANLTFADFRHFSGNRTIFTGNFSQFQLLDYFQFSTRHSYFEGHFNHHFNGFIFNKIPLLKDLKWQEVISLNYLQTSQSGPYLELGAGIEHVFKVGRVDFFTSLQRGQHVGSGIRVGLGI
jgi:hypothetical protein